ncbi:hypothetical protein [Candidatus Vidania fulgoroideorum]
MEKENIQKLYNKEFFFIEREKISIKEKDKIRGKFVCLEKQQATNSLIKALFYIRRYIYMEKKIAIIISRGIGENKIIRKLSRLKLLIRRKYIYYNGIINKEIKEKKKDIVVVIGGVNSKFIKETRKLGVVSIQINNKIKNKQWKPNIYVRCNTNSNISIINILKQIYFQKKVYLLDRNRKEEKTIRRYYISEDIYNGYIVIIGIRFKSDFYIARNYICNKIGKITKYIKSKIQDRKEIIGEIRNIIKRIELIYNEKIRIFSIKKITSRFKIKYYIHNNKSLSFCICRQNDRGINKVLMNILAYKDINSNNILKEPYIFKEEKLLGEILEGKKHIKFFIIK